MLIFYIKTRTAKMFLVYSQPFYIFVSATIKKECFLLLLFYSKLKFYEKQLFYGVHFYVRSF